MASAQAPATNFGVNLVSDSGFIPSEGSVSPDISSNTSEAPMSDSFYSKDETDAKLDARDSRLESKIERTGLELNSKIDKLAADIREGFMSLRSEMREDSLAIRGEINVIKSDIGWLKWLSNLVILLLLGILVSPIVLQLLHLK